MKGCEGDGFKKRSSMLNTSDKSTDSGNEETLVSRLVSVTEANIQ